MCSTKLTLRFERFDDDSSEVAPVDEGRERALEGPEEGAGTGGGGIKAGPATPNDPAEERRLDEVDS